MSCYHFGKKGNVSFHFGKCSLGLWPGNSCKKIKSDSGPFFLSRSCHVVVIFLSRSCYFDPFRSLHDPSRRLHVPSRKSSAKNASEAPIWLIISRTTDQTVAAKWDNLWNDMQSVSRQRGVFESVVATLISCKRWISCWNVLHSIDLGERVSQPISKVDEPVYLKSSRRNFTILRVTLEQETTEKHFWPQRSTSLWRCVWASVRWILINNHIE